VIAVQSLHVQAGSFELANVSFTVPGGAFAALMGRTGVGKTTLMEAICGLKQVVSGTIRLGERDVTALKPAERGIGFVPQEAALFPAMSVRDHLSFALRIRRWPRQRIHERVEELAELLSITHLLARRPDGLSGGEQQRVALGRALSFRPSVLCLDEPLAALDEQTRQQMHDLFRRVRGHSHVTTLAITHNREDAEALADRVLVLESGRIRSPS